MNNLIFSRRSRLQKYFLLSAVILCASVLGTIVMRHELVGHFIFGDFSTIKATLAENHFVRMEPSKLTPGYDMILYTVGAICGMPLESVAFLPVGILFVPFVYFVLSSRLFGNNFVSFLLGFFLVLEAAQTAWSNTFAYSWTRSTYLVFVLLALGLFTRGHKINLSVALIVIFAGTTFIHYAAPLWMLTFLVVPFLLMASTGDTKGRKLALMIVLFTVLYLLVSNVVYDMFIPKFVSTSEEGGYGSIFYTFYMKLKSHFLGGSLVSEKYVYYPSTGIYDIGRLCLNFLILIPVLIALPRAILRFFRKTPKSSGSLQFRRDPKFYVFFGLFVTMLVEAFAYGIVTGISNQVLLFMGPVIALVGMDGLSRKRWRWLFLVALVLLSAVLVPTSIKIAEKNTLTYSEAGPSSQWIFSIDQNDHIKVLCTVSFTYYANYIGLNYNKSMLPSYFSTTAYENLTLITGGNSSLLWDYVIVDSNSYRNYAGGVTLTAYEPLSWYEGVIANDTNFVRPYDDGMIWILETL